MEFSMKVSLINDDALKVSIIKSGSRYRESPAVVVKPSVELVSGENRLGPWLVKVAEDSINVSVNNMNATLRFSYSNDQIIVRGNLGLNDAVYGLGEKALPLNRKRFRVTMWNTDAYGYRYGSDPLYVSIPFFIITNKNGAIGHFADSTAKVIIDLGAEKEDEFTVIVNDYQLDYYIIRGPRLKDVVTRFINLTGKPTLMPKWALGHQQSRYSYYPQDRVIEIIKTFKEKELDNTVVYLDIHYMDGYRIFTWSKDRFPNPTELAKAAHELGVKLVTIVDPYVKVDPNYYVFKEGINGNHLSLDDDGGLSIVQGWPGKSALPDFFNKEAREWWASLIERWVREYGVDGIWLDMNEPAAFDYPNHTVSSKVITHRLDDDSRVPHDFLHNAYALYEAMATYDGLVKAGRRPFVLSRAGYAGIQRYAAVWTGDNTSNWEHLRLQLQILLGLSISGVTFIGADVGGFAKYVPGSGGNVLFTLSPELLVRWYEWAIFFPLLRNHASIGSPDQEPWAFGPRTLELIKNLLRLRARLTPYLYSLMWLSHINGEPIVRPLIYEYPNDEEVINIDDEFMLGPFMLIAPMLTSGNAREVYLPEGEWVNMWSGEVLNKGFHIVDAPLGKPPVFLRRGSLIPVQETQGVLGVLTVLGEGEFTVYDDDGESSSPTPSTLSLRISGESITVGNWINPMPQSPSSIILEAYVNKEPGKVTINDTEVAKAKFNIEPGPPSWYMDKLLYIRAATGSNVKIIN
ncbi:glycoside hydrolase family 31 protein [Caldivirga maquilingensis]|uniref:Alpha-glucosidase n=1 Tax=Caldivirga maquilingensis (strain ATCC 700844 / DSM 13496 / JCM 10307 / IC-167) TaxID=397948 RepID=A8MAD8_CALMQ|nr:glycoside hydrolase family 31 protein [Caldivirga maquilingensis]ABW02515.1 Alpha-glucosidase [Caldivirga maquilingensis IC-167]